MEIRNVTADEMAEYLSVGRYAFAFWGDEPISHEALETRRLEDSFAVFVDGQVVATLHNIPFEQSVRGVWKSMGGVASVATFPEHRRKGYVRALIRRAFEDMRDKDQPVTILYPFRDTFYAAFGYVTAHSHMEVTVSSSSLAHYMPHAKLPEGMRYERRNAKDVRACRTDFLRDQMGHVHGLVIDPARPDTAYVRYNKDWLVVFVMNGDRADAIATYRLKGYGDEGTLDVYDMYWLDRTARDRLFGYFALHGTDANKVKLPAAYGDHFQSWLRQPADPYKLDMNFRTPMGRVVDVIGAVNGLPGASAGELSLSLEDEYAPWNSGTYTLSATNGTLSAERSKSDTPITISVQGISALVYGTLPLAEIIHRGWVSGLDSRTTALLESWFPPQPIYMTYGF